MSLFYDPWRHAEEIGIKVVEDDLPTHWRGAYKHAEHLIILRPGMSQREARSTLAHEIQHALAGDIPSPFGPVTRRQEVLANRRAAELLIDSVEYAFAEELKGPHLPSIAQYLNVTVRVVENWQNSITSHQAVH